jgi:aminocarboxymuconate-semialdehyde decarboxylase
MADVSERVRNMDQMGVDVQVLTCSLVHQCTYWADPQTGLDLERRSNDRLAEMVRSNPGRFAALGGVPLQAPTLAVGELERCMELGLKGVQISTRVDGMEIGDARLRPFWAKAEELGAVVYIHPAGNDDPRLQKFQLWNSLGQSMEEAFAIASLFYEGVLDAFPTLKICISHGGGYMPYYTGRIDRNYVEKANTRINMTKPPIEYLRMLYYDSCVYDEAVLAHLIDKVGEDRVVLGSDYPVGDPEPVDFIRGSRHLSEVVKDKILGKNAALLLGL